MAKERIDKIIASRLGISRTDARGMLKSGRVAVNGERVKLPGFKADPEADNITADGQPLDADEFIYIMLNKPQGIVSASRSENDRTVVDLVPDELRRKNLFPAGRLDKDTTGFVLITNDGGFAHDILSPARHVEKTYIAGIDGEADDELCRRFSQGIAAKNGEIFKSAELTVLKSDKSGSLCEVKITEGRYHQIKRMFAACGFTVTSLHRTHIGGLELSDKLEPGECKRLDMQELQRIQKNMRKIGK